MYTCALVYEHMYIYIYTNIETVQLHSAWISTISAGHIPHFLPGIFAKLAPLGLMLGAGVILTGRTLH